MLRNLNFTHIQDWYILAKLDRSEQSFSPVHNLHWNILFHY